MTRPLLYLAAAVAAVAVALVVYAARTPCAPGSRRPQHRGWHTARVS